jgi:hypothetical protein
MLVIRSVLGTRKTIVFVSLVVVMATISGLIFGHFSDQPHHIPDIFSPSSTVK